jgi:multiple sugar transport system permease protein
MSVQAEYGSKFSRNAYRLGIYGALISGAIIFSMPFVWMISTSLKEDDEQMQKDLVWVPRLPPYCPRSPYLDAREGVKLEAPGGLKPEQFSELEPLITPALEPLVNAVPPEKFGATPLETARPLLMAALWKDISSKIPKDKFTRAELPAQLATFATAEQTQKSIERLYRAIAIGKVSLRARGEPEVLLRVGLPEQLAASEPLDGTWTVHESKAETGLRPRQEKTRVDSEGHYAFNEPGERMTFSTEVPFEKTELLKTVSLRLKGDGSWNRLWASIDVDGSHYEARTPNLLFGKRFAEVYFQLPSADDDNDMLIRDWTTTTKSTSDFNQKGRVRLTISVENTSAWTKFYDKATYNYRHALHYIPFWRYLFTSLFLVGINVILSIFSSSLVAYAFARLNWPGRKYCWALLLATVMIPGQVTVIPTFLIFKWLGWFNTLKPLWVGSAFGSVFFVFMLREFMKGIPKDLEDSAKIDGCNYWQIYWNVIIPLVKPTLAAIGIFTFMGTWNEFMGPLMYLSDQKLYPLSLGLFAFQTVAGSNQGMMMAASLLMTLPVIALFFVAQRHFIQGVAFSGIKG